MGCGLERLLADSDPEDVQRHLQLMQGAKRLTLPSEMGERFKVLGLSRGLRAQPIGFSCGICAAGCKNDSKSRKVGSVCLGISPLYRCPLPPGGIDLLDAGACDSLSGLLSVLVWSGPSSPRTSQMACSTRRKTPPEDKAPARIPGALSGPPHRPQYQLHSLWTPQGIQRRQFLSSVAGFQFHARWKSV